MKQDEAIEARRDQVKQEIIYIIRLGFAEIKKQMPCN
jgi:hypothetical protein